MSSSDLSASSPTPRSPALSVLADYLRVSGWIMEDQDTRTSLWRPVLKSREDISLVLPVQENVTDYDEVVYAALRVLSYLEHRSLNEVAGDVVFGAADTVAVRLTPEAPSGQAPLSLAYEAVSALRSYVIGSGAALNERSLVLPARRSRQAEAYASEARLATLPGSFILSLTLPLVSGFERASVSVQPHDDVVDEMTSGPQQEELVKVPPQPFGRRVTNRMATAAKYAQRLAEEVSVGNQRLPIFGQMNSEATNATELEALSGLGGTDKDPYQLRFAQSPLAPQRLHQETLMITPGQQRIMGEAAEYLRTRQSRPSVTVEGLVVNLSRNSNYGPGEVIVRGVSDDSGTARRFHVELTEDSYNEALRAHQSGLQVVVNGALDARGNWKWIRPLRSFSIVAGLDYEGE
jgi:hypothetical protein